MFRIALRRPIRSALIGALLWLPLSGLFTPSAMAQRSTEVIRVATYECPPFVEKKADGYAGISMLLWEEIAKNNGLEYTVTDYGLAELLAAVRDGDADVGVSCISITREREEFIDFSHSFYETHLAIATRGQSYLAGLGTLLTDRKLLSGMGIVALIALVIGTVLFALEHRINGKLFPRSSRWGHFVELFLLGLQFITRGPVRYYEFITLSGRVIATLLTITSTVFIASVTALLASAFTVQRLNTSIQGPEDLVQMKVGAKSASTASQYLDNSGVIHRRFDTVESMLEALDSQQVDAVVADDAVLRYQIKQAREKGRYDDVTVLPYQFEKQNYGLVLPDNTPRLENVNQALLEVRKSDRWKLTLQYYLNQK